MPSPRTLVLRSDLRACLTDGIFYCLMVGIGETYLAAFVLRLGLGPIAAGLILTVPVVAGAFLQLYSPALVRRVGSYPKWTALCAYIQAAMYLPLAAIALFGPSLIPSLRDAGLLWLATLTVFTVATLYWAAGLACGPAWNTLAGVIVPARIRAHYFARRTRWLQLATLFALLSHGWIIEAVRPIAEGIDFLAHDPVMPGFALAFTLAGAARAISAYFLSRYSDPPHPPDAERHVHLSDFISRIRRGHDGRFLFYVIAVSVAAQVAQPFFNPYMIEQLDLSRRAFFDSAPSLGSAYGWFLAASFLGKALILPAAGAFAHRLGPLRALLIGGIGLVPLSLIWLVTDNLPILLIGQVISGMLWGIWELSVFLLNYETIKPDERTSVLTNFTLVNELAKTSGSLIGGSLLDLRGKDIAAYSLIFWISTALRLITLLLIARIKPHPQADKTTEVIDAGPMAVRPAVGSIDEPLLTDPPTTSSRN